MKTKSSLWLVISTFVLCLGVMVTGVFSALSVNLSISGMLGFNMHNAMINAKITVKNITIDGSTTNKQIERTFMGTELPLQASLDFDDLYFSSGNDMIFEIAFTNLTQTALTVTMPQPTITNQNVTLISGTDNGYTDFTSENNTYKTALATNSGISVSFALSLTNQQSLSTPISFDWANILFEELEEVPDEYIDSQGLIYTLNTTKDAWSVKGIYTEPITNSDISRALPDGPGNPDEPSSSSNYINNVKVPNVVIEEELFNIPVTTIEENAFGVSANISYDSRLSCTIMQSISIPNTVTTIGFEAFYGCSGLKGTFVIPDSITSIGMWAFYSCDRIAKVIIGDGLSNLQMRVFGSCASLSSVTIGSSISTINTYAFTGSTNIKEVINKSSLTISAGSTTYGDLTNKSTTFITTNPNASKVLVDLNDFIWYNNSSSDKQLLGWCGVGNELNFPNGITEVPADFFVVSETDITSVTIPNSVNTIGDGVFDGYLNLNRVNISSLESWCKIVYEGKYVNSSPLCNGANIYLNNELLTEITIPNTITTINQMAFYNCTSITSVVILSSVKSIGTYAFCSCDNLTSVTFESTTPPTFGDYVFSSCNSNLIIDVPNNAIDAYKAVITPSGVATQVQ